LVPPLSLSLNMCLNSFSLCKTLSVQISKERLKVLAVWLLVLSPYALWICSVIFLMARRPENSEISAWCLCSRLPRRGAELNDSEVAF